MINKQSNVYTILYITIMVILVGAVLAITATSLKPRQQENAQADKKSQILQAVHISTTRATVIEDFNKYITSQIVVNAAGDEIEGADAFSIDVAAEAKKDSADRMLPVYICVLPEAGKKYILPLAGMGLWGPIWGYVAFNEDGSTIYGAFFDHQGETPGLGAEITKPAFTDRFEGKQVFKNGNFYPIEVVKAGQKPLNSNVDYVDGVSGGTITSKGVSAMFDNCLKPYRNWLDKIAHGSATPVITVNGEVLPTYTGDNIPQQVIDGQTIEPATGDLRAQINDIKAAERDRVKADAAAETAIAKKLTGDAN